MQAQQRSRGAPAEALAAAAQLRDGDTVAVVTGQQAGLFGGPLFTLLKALTAVRLAEQVRAQHHVPAVAIFWIDAEDHDWDEVKRCAVLDADATRAIVELGDPPGAHTAAIARVRLDDSVTAAHRRARSALRPPNSHRPHRQPPPHLSAGIGMADAFGRWLESLLGSRGLVVFNSADPGGQAAPADVFAREIERAGDTSRRRRTGRRRPSRRCGYHAQADAGRRQPGAVRVERRT